MLVALSAATFVFSARAGLLTPKESELRAKYSLPGSRFLEIDGQSIHFADEGSGEPVILIHGSFGSLLNWNDWATAFADDYRVIRLDLPRMGLSGPSPSGRYGAGANVETIQALSEELQLERFFLVGTSSGGETAAAYAAQYPDRVKALILSNIAAEPFAMDRSHLSPWFKFLIKIDPVFKGWHPTLFWREVLRNNFFDPGRIKPALVLQWTDLNNRAQRMPPRVFSADDPVPFARTPADLARIESPTLLLWSEHDSELPVESVGQKALGLLGAPGKELQVVADCGHMMPLECGPESARMARSFLVANGDGPPHYGP